MDLHRDSRTSRSVKRRHSSLDPYEPYKSGEIAGIDLMIGTNRDEMNYWVGEIGGIVPFSLGIPIKFENDLMAMNEEEKKRARQYLKSCETTEKNPVWRLSSFYTEMMFRQPAILQAEYHARSGGRTYMYWWTEPSTLRYLGACHAVELAYVFGNLEETIYTGEKGSPLLSRDAQNLWVSFARTGVPQTGSLAWPAYEEEKRSTMVLSRHPAVKEDPLADSRELLSPLCSCWINPSYADMKYNVPFVRRLAGAAVAVVIAIVAAILIIF